MTFPLSGHLHLFMQLAVSILIYLYFHLLHIILSFILLHVERADNFGSLLRPLCLFFIFRKKGISIKVLLCLLIDLSLEA